MDIQQHPELEILDELQNFSIFPTDLKGDYGCMITFDDGVSKQSIRYRLIIQCIEEVHEQLRYYRIERNKSVYINDRQPETFMDQLALQISEVLYPLEIAMTYDGTFNQVLNHEEIQERWMIKREKLQKKYSTPMVASYIARTDQALRSPKALIGKLQKDWFLTLYFAPLYKWYTEELVIDTHITYPTAGAAPPIRYQVTQQLAAVVQETTTDYRIKIRGVIDEDRSVVEVIQGVDSPYDGFNDAISKLEGTCAIDYLLNGKTGIVEGYEANFTTHYDPPQKITVKMFLQEQIAVVHEEEKKGFWAKLFNL